jgi:uncharacterized glyoxalase superfamily protein PhnB
MVKFTASAPILLVKDVVKAAAHYRDQLGFADVRLYYDPPNFAMVSRDGFTIMLAQAAHPERILPNWKIHGSTSQIYFWVDDIDTLYAEYQSSGATIDFTLYDTPWGTREFGVQDIDGYDISFGQVISQ